MTQSTEKHVHFIADEVGVATDYGVLTCGATSSQSNEEPHYFTVQANLEEPDEWGVYFEIDDQINGGYQRLRRVHLCRSQLVLTVNQGTDWYPNLERVIADVSGIDAADMEALLVALNRCLAQCELEVEVLDDELDEASGSA